jgi:hypothetical protein
MLIKKIFNDPVLKFLALTLAFGIIYSINNLLTPFLRLVPAAHLIHIPSGIKFLMVLIFWLTGALSIATVSMLAGIFVYFPDNYSVCAELALVNAISPLLTLFFFKGAAPLDELIAKLNWSRVLRMGIVFSILNSSMNQLILYWNGITFDFLTGLEVMMIGDITGFYITISILKFFYLFLKK